MTKKLKLIITYDHELPLGGWTAPFHACLFDQTEEVLSIGDEFNVPVTLFTDILSAVRFKQWDSENFYGPYKKQIVRAITTGHDVQLHLHPHWLTSRYDNSVLFPSNDFGLADFENGKDGYTIESIIKLGVDTLNEICLPEKPDYKCIAYRAGGFNLSPCTQKITEGLSVNGIRFDSSINKGFYYKSSISEVDYRKTPSLMNWFLPLSTSQSKVEGIYEVPIAGIKAGLITNLQHIYRKYAWKDQKPSVRGKTIHSGKTSLIDKLKFVFSTRMLTFDLYTLTIHDLKRIVESELTQLQKSDVDVAYMATIAHPKLMGKYNFQLKRDFLQVMKDKFADSIEFISFQQALDELKHTF